MTPRTLNHTDLRPAGDRELDLLIACARSSVEPAQAERICAIVEGGLNWDRLWTLGQRHGLSLLYGSGCAGQRPRRQAGVPAGHFR